MDARVTQSPAPSAAKRKPFYLDLSIQVLIGIAIAIVLGNFWPGIAVAMQPLGNAFIKLIKMAIGLVIFFTVVSGIAGMQSMKKVGTLGGKALIYFEVVSTLALLLGLVVGNWLQPGAGMHADPSKLDAGAVAQYAGRAKEMGIVDFLMNIIPNTVVDAFAKGDILSVVFVSVLFGCVLAHMGERGRPLRELVDHCSGWVFGAINVVMKLAPIGAFGAMAFTVGRDGLASLGPLLKLIVIFYLTNIFFVVVVLGGIAWMSGFSLTKYLLYIKEEILIVLGTSSSDSGLPGLMAKMEFVGCSKSVVGLIVPTSYIFNTCGTSIYMTMAALFVAQATGTELTWMQQGAIFAVTLLTSKGAVGVTGIGFVALVGTLSVVPTVPLAGMALILGIDRFMSEARALLNMIGSGVAAIALARHEGELDVGRMRAVLDGKVKFKDYAGGPGEAAKQEVSTSR